VFPVDVRNDLQDELAGPQAAAGRSASPPGGASANGTGLSLVVAFFALAGLFLGVAAIVVAFNRPKEGTVATSSANGTVEGAIALSEFSIGGDLTLPPGHVQLSITNNGSQAHDFEVVGVAKSGTIQPGQTAALHLGQLPAGEYQLRCNVPGHADAGMKNVLTIDRDAPAPAAGSASGDASAASGTAGTTATTMDWAHMDQMMLDSLKAFPATTAGKGNQLMTPQVTPDGVKEFDLTAAVIDWEVEPGKTVKAWAYNGQVPGPVIKVGVGDKIRIKITNNLPAATDIHSHGISLPNDMDGVAGVTQKVVAPGETFAYEFTTEKAAVGMYHAHLHGDVAVPNGLFGAFLIGDMPLPAGRTIGGIPVPADVKVAQELPMVLNDAGVIGLSLNGKGFPATEPIVAKVGDWIEVHYMNEGLLSHPMHPHQFPQLVIARDGIPLDQPYWSDTLSVAPGERYTVLMHVDRPGTWVWHCHILNHVERETGMFGMVTALVVKA
jgi:uncharacterized cupredoxin-like copper-binding protein